MLTAATDRLAAMRASVHHAGARLLRSGADEHASGAHTPDAAAAPKSSLPPASMAASDAELSALAAEGGAWEPVDLPAPVDPDRVRKSTFLIRFSCTLEMVLTVEHSLHMVCLC